MKIECDKCGAKYSIADEKVRGKTFKIRCKKCSNVIIVRDKAASSGAVSGAAPEATDPGWHLAINGETVGPIPESEVRQRYQAGEIDRDTAVWQEGFEDWVPLADVPTFSDLPERIADQPISGAVGGFGSGPEPIDSSFGAPSSKPYAAAAGGLGSSAMGGASDLGSAPFGLSGPASSRLTGQRNENSVLFSLDSLQSLATGRGSSAPVSSIPSNARTGTKGLATVAPSSEGSGLIDIRALGAMVAQDAPRAAASAGASGFDEAALPSFSGAGLGGLASAPLVPQHLPDPAAVAPPLGGRSNLPLYIILVLLIFAVAGLAVLFLTRDNTPQIVERQVPVAPSVKAGDEDEDEDRKRKRDKDEEGEEEEDPEAAEDAADDGGPDADGTARPRTSKKTTTTRRSSGSSSKSSAASSAPAAKADDGLGDLPDLPSGSSKSSSKSPAAPAGPSKAELSADCILDPTGPGCGGGSTKKAATPKTEEKKAESVDPNLPESLTSSDIRDGIESVKNAAKACGPKNGAAPGTSVKVKLSISGSTGKVTEAAAQAPHAGTALGSCVAAALKKASFKKFRKSSIGAVYPVRM